MASREPQFNDRNLRLLLDLFTRLPRPVQIAAVVLLVVALIAYAVLQRRPDRSGGPAGPPVGSGEAGTYLFCFWNVENLFDDHEDRRNSIDRPYDEAFATDESFRRLKYDHLAEALLRMNGGTGPDVVACAEVESTRAADLLMAAFNAKIPDPDRRYRSVAMHDLNAGRHIAPCVITRLGVVPADTRLHGGNLRILETHVTLNGYDLCVLATHWTSQIRREGGHGEAGREKYARVIHEVAAGITGRNPSADLLVCGDFNTTPDSDEVVNVLGAVGDRSRVRPGGTVLLDLMAGKSPERYGTLWYGGKPLIYDQICVSAGLLDPAGWSCDPDSVATFTEGLTRPGASRRQPWRFGDPGHGDRSERGYSDHFPVTVRLSVQAAPAAKGG